MRSSCLLVVSATLPLLSLARPAHAQDASAAIYSDVKQVIQQLIDQEVSQTVAPRLACFTGRTVCVPDSADAPCGPNAVELLHDKTGKTHQWVNLEAITYFPQTLRLIYDGQYSNLRTTILSEASGLAADVAYHLLTESSDDPETLAKSELAAAAAPVSAPGTMASHALPGRTPSAAEIDAQVRVINRRRTRAWRRALGFTFRQADTVAPSAGQTKIGASIGPNVRAMGSAASGGAAPSPAAASSDDVTFVPLPDDQLENCADGVTQQLAAHEIGGGTTPLMSECAATNPARNEYACDIAFALQDELQGDPSDADQSIQSAVAALVADWAVQGKASSDQFTAVAPIVRTMLASTGVSRDAAATAAKGILTALTALKASAASGGTTPSSTAPALADENKLTDRLTRVLDEWKVFHPAPGSKVTLATYVDGMEGLVVLIADGCKTAPGSSACRVISNESKVIGITSQLAALVGLASRGDYVDAAQLAVDDLFQGISSMCSPTAAGSKPQTTCAQYRIYEDFADAVVVYVSDIATDGSPSQAASQAFQVAAEDLLRQVANGGGIDRPCGWAILAPDLALRYSWSPSYVNASDGTARGLASVTTLNLRAPFYRRDLFYSALKVSLVDALAPVAELATRRTTNVNYDNEALVALELITPRVDFEAGVPALSKHLLVGGGLSYRLVVPVSNPALGAPATATAPAVVGYRYEGVWDDSWKHWAQAFEFGVFAKYSL